MAHTKEDWDKKVIAKIYKENEETIKQWKEIHGKIDCYATVEDLVRMQNPHYTPHKDITKRVIYHLEFVKNIIDLYRSWKK